MGKLVQKKEKGRPLKSNLARRAGSSRNPVSESKHRQTIRRRNLTYAYDFDDDEEEDEEEGRRRRRREKELKLVLRLPPPSRSNKLVLRLPPPSRSNKDEGLSGVDSVKSQIHSASSAEGRQRRKVDQTSETSSDYEHGNKQPSRKRKIDGEYCFHNYGDDDDDGDEGLLRFGYQKEERGANAESKGLDFLQGFALPDRQQLELILDKLQRKDIYGVFAEPVDAEELPDYHDVIENPMDFETVRKKLANGTYYNLEELENDVLLICSNAMQYNAPETIYYKQANSIKDLARKKFRRLRIDCEHTNQELKSEQKTKLNSLVKKPVKKFLCTPPQEPVGSDFSSGATLATVVATYTLSKPIQAGACEEPSNVQGFVNENSSLTENKPDEAENRPDEAEEQLSVKGLPSEFGRKQLVIDENRRATYNISDQPVVPTESIFTLFEGKSKQLVADGLHVDYSYARSLTRFAATLGRVPWEVASRRIEQALPAGLKFGRGWVGEYEPLPTPVLMLGNRTQEKQLLASQIKTESRMDVRTAEGLRATQDELGLLRTRNLSAVANPSKLLDPVKGFPCRPISENKPPLFGVPGAKPIFHATNQLQNQLTMKSAKPDNILKQIELNCSPANASPVDASSRNQLQHDLEMKNSRQVEMVSRNVNLVQSVPFMKQDMHRVGTGELLNKKGMTSTDIDSVDNSSDFISNIEARVGTYFPHGNHSQGLNDPNHMRMLAEKAQIQQRPSNSPTIDPQQVRVLVPSLKRDDSSAAASAAARAWMSLGATQAQFKPLERSKPQNMQISAASFYNPTREFSQRDQQFRGETASSGLQLQSINRFQPQPPGNESHFQNNKQMVFPQLVTADLSQFQTQSLWRGFIQHTQTNKKRDMLPPDLNITFQSGSPVKQSSGILADSQQPDLALQL